MKSMDHTLISLLLLPPVVLGCTSAGPDSGGSAGNIELVVCEVFYRAGTGQPLAAAQPISLDGNERKGEIFAAMSFEAFYQEDEFEGQALSVVIVDRETGAEISRQLFQFDPDNSPENQFVGGHGFTGLNYAFHPSSSGEIQYFCRVKSD